MNENIKLTIQLCVDQNRILSEYIESEFKIDFHNALIKFPLINDSIEKLHFFLKNIF